MVMSIRTKRLIIMKVLLLAAFFISYFACSWNADATPVLSSASPNPVVVVPGGPEVALTLRGSGLEQIATCAVVRNKQIVSGVAASLGAPSASARQVTLRANKGTLTGDAQLRFISGKNFMDVPLNMVRISITSTPPAQQAAPYPPGGSIISAAIPRRPASSIGSAPGAYQGRSKLPLSFVEVAAYPGVRPIRTAAPRLPAVPISAVRAVREGGGPATGIELKPVQGPRGQKLIDIIVRANAVAGRYGMEFFANGKWNALQQGAFGLTIVPPQGNMTPLGAIIGIVNARTGLGNVSGPGAGIGGPGSQGDGRNIGQPFGLSDSRTNPKQGLSGSRGVGDPRLMEGETDDTVDVEVSASDTTNADGSTDVSETITTTDSNGNTMTDKSSAHIDANGNSTESQDVTVTDKNGNVIASSHSTGSSTPNPEKAGCTTEQCRQQMQWVNQMLTPIIKRMQDFAIAKITGLRGDQRADGGSSGNRAGAGFRTGGGLVKPGSRVIDPNPESGGSSGSSPFGPIQSTAPKKDLKGTLPDPGEPGRTTPALPPGVVKPEGGRGDGGSPTPFPSQTR